MKYQLLTFICAIAISVPMTLAQDSDSSKRPRPVNDPISLQGVLNPIETLRLATRDPGIVEDILVTEGDKVSAGDTIAVLDKPLFTAELNAAKNELRVAQEESKNNVDLEFAKISREVNQKVIQRSQAARARFAKSVSKTELEELCLESERSRLSALQAQRQININRINEELRNDRVEIAQIRLNNRAVKSKIDGTVVQVLAKPGEFVNTGQPIARILNLNRLRIVCASKRGMQPNDIPKQAKFKINVAGKEFTYPAKITFVSPEIDPVRQTFPIWAEIENVEARLNSGQVGKLVFEDE